MAKVGSHLPHPFKWRLGPEKFYHELLKRLMISFHKLLKCSQEFSVQFCCGYLKNLVNILQSHKIEVNKLFLRVNEFLRQFWLMNVRWEFSYPSLIHYYNLNHQKLFQPVKLQTGKNFRLPNSIRDSQSTVGLGSFVFQQIFVWWNVIMRPTTNADNSKK